MPTNHLEVVDPSVVRAAFSMRRIGTQKQFPTSVVPYRSSGVTSSMKAMVYRSRCVGSMPGPVLHLFGEAADVVDSCVAAVAEPMISCSWYASVCEVVIARTMRPACGARVCRLPSPVR